VSLYGGEHQAIRRATLPYAYGQPCARCGRPLLPGQPLDLDHHDDRTGYLGYSHQTCNRAAGARKGNALRRVRRERAMAMLTECALAVEVAEDRRHVSIVAAGEVDGFAAVEVAAYLIAVADTVPAVLRLQVERTVAAVVVDPRSGAANLIRPLTDAGVKVTEPSYGDVAAAHGEFLDRAAAGELRHVSSVELDAAVRVGTERRLGGGTAWDRRTGGTVDVSPAVAAELALWGWMTRPPPLPRSKVW